MGLLQGFDARGEFPVAVSGGLAQGDDVVGEAGGGLRVGVHRADEALHGGDHAPQAARQARHSPAAEDPQHDVEALQERHRPVTASWKVRVVNVPVTVHERRQGCPERSTAWLPPNWPTVKFFVPTAVRAPEVARDCQMPLASC